MNGIRFGEVHSFEDLNLILSKVDLPPAAVKTVYVDNPGGDGSWDLTEATGKVNYKNREAKFTFSVLPEDDFEAKKTEVSNLLNGKRFKITLDKDPAYYWDGRCTVNQYESNKKMRKIVVGASVAPYKLKQEKTRVFVPFCGKNLFDCNDLQKIGGSSANIASISTGVRATWVQGNSAYVLIKWLPLEMLVGKEITLSCNITESGGAKGTMQIGYAAASGSPRQSKVKLESTGSVSFTVEKINPEYEYLAIWFYANNGGTPSAGAFVDYTNITIELGNTLAERRNILPFPYPENTVTGEGVTFTSNADGGISATGTATGQKNFTLYYGDLLTDGVITFSLSGEFENLTAVLVLRDEAKETLLNRNVETSFTVNLDDYPTADKMEILIKRKINAEVSGTIYPQLEKGTVATPYTPFVPFEPYVARVPTGKNLLPYPYNDAGFVDGVINRNEVTFTDLGDGRIKINGTPTAGTTPGLWLSHSIDFISGQTYSMTNTISRGVYFYVYYTDKSGATKFYETPFTWQEGDSNARVLLQINKVQEYNDLILSPQIELGTTETEYEPFTDKHTITLTNGRKTVSPTIICTDEAKIKVNGAEFALGEGANKILDFSLSEGENTVTIGGSGAAAIVYQEGDL